MSTSASGTSEFSGFRAYFWPVHSYELKKLLPMLCIFFLLTFNYNILRTLKDPLVMHVKGSGAEALPFIKVWVMLPLSIFMTFLFTRLSNRYSRESVFYILTSIFLAYYILYAAVLYPNREALHPNATADYLQGVLPVGFKGVIAMCRNWTGTLFYVMSELWSNIVLFVLFWGFANQITRLSEAKRFYGLFGVGANFSGFVSGQIGVYLARGEFNPNLPFGLDAWEQSMDMQIIAVTLSGLAAMALFCWFNRTILTDDRFKPLQEEQPISSEKPRFSLRESVGILFKSRYILYITVIVLSYNLVINIVEVLWKHEVKELYSNAKDYNIYMNQVSSLIGVLATITALFISGNSIRRFGWTFTAMLTPVILFVTSIGFFGFFFIKESVPDVMLGALNLSPLALVVFFGSAQNVMSRAAKYSVFDATKEMAFIPLPYDMKVKGKAAIDGICSRMGKSGGSLIHQSLLLIFGSLTVSAPYAGAFLLTTIGIWSVATYLLGQEFNSKTAPSSAVPSSPLEEGKPAFLAERMVLKEQKAV